MYWYSISIDMMSLVLGVSEAEANNLKARRSGLFRIVNKIESHEVCWVEKSFTSVDSVARLTCMIGIVD